MSRSSVRFRSLAHKILCNRKRFIMPPPLLVVSDSKGNLFEIPGLLMAGSSLNSKIVPDERSIIPLPQSSVIFMLPKRIPVGYDAKQKKFIKVKEYNGTPVFAAAAFMPPGYIRTLNSAYIELPGAPRLPLYCYSAIGMKNGRFYVAGNRIDRQKRHEITDLVLSAVNSEARTILKRYPGNRLVYHLVNNCALKYNCPNAINFVLCRWECPIPVSSDCNAVCIGCISRQSKNSGFPASQDRIDFIPTVQEIIEYVVPHLKNAANPIASFGQGCEGEPLLEAKLIEESISAIRSRTSRGIININTNASMPDAIEFLCKAGLNSIRVSINSAQPDFYKSYYRPHNYSFNDVLQSMKIAKRYKVWISINYLVFPGFTDNLSELRALKNLVRTTKLNMIQTRNLNIDPLMYKETMGNKNYSDRSIGMVSWIEAVKTSFPNLLLGYFNPTCKTIHDHIKRT
jgi:pyruvate-formate lyase-activating enzyme